ncbi:NUDIX domain-containing protein [Irregularibacter muris]|uniref:NUDIX domain-containing protein n=1 Tax=Irregularibacter muris TaxID=1796619 RepID=A0AAE3HGF7_9FIRM|nr:NUDIX domain-containing protein [Irregularibacter muris]MCR1898579.1 NUDIX domain-containing protein [Irregularibacter muris]
MVDKTLGKRIDGVKYYDRKGAYLIAVEKNMLAVVQTPKGYFLLGGGFEEKENHIECIKRECLEETGYDVVIQDYIGCAEEYCLHNELGYFHPLQFYYSGKIASKISEPIENDHIFNWISMENIEEKMYIKAQAWAVRNYLDRGSSCRV